MKKTIVYVLILMLIFGTTGCGPGAKKSGIKSLDDQDKVPAFACQDLDGNNVSSDIFSGSKFTLVNIWTTG